MTAFGQVDRESWGVMSDNVERYTLSEARHILLLEQCATSGHDLEYGVDGAEELIRVACGHCGSSWSTVRTR